MCFREKNIMKTIEKQIIKNLLKSGQLDFFSKIELNALTQKQPLGSSSAEFRKHPAFNQYINQCYGDGKNYFMLWLQIEDYLDNRNNKDSAQEKLNQVEEALTKCLENTTAENKSHGTAMLPQEIANAQFMRNLYSINDENLNTIFLKYLLAQD